MIWFSIIDNAAGAAKYFTPEGCDYHLENEQTYAFFGGRSAKPLGLGDFNLGQFKRMLHGLHPTEDHKLTVGAKKDTNRLGYEVIFDGPKDLSVLWMFADWRIPGVMELAMRDTLDYIEADAKARVGSRHGRGLGHGETTMLVEYGKELDRHGVEAVWFGTTNTEVDELQARGLPAVTVARFLQSEAEQERAAGARIFVDESSMLVRVIDPKWV